MKITSEAVEAGAKAIWELDDEFDLRVTSGYEDCSEATKRQLRHEARATIEAALPYLDSNG